MIVTFDLDGTIPSKKNSKQIFKNSRTGKRFPSTSDRFKIWEQGSRYQINLQKGSRTDIVFPIKKCEYIECTLFYGDRRGRDNSNTIESIHDLLVDTGIILDDKWQITGTTIQIPIFREKEPGARIVIKVLEDSQNRT